MLVYQRVEFPKVSSSQFQPVNHRRFQVKVPGKLHMATEIVKSISLTDYTPNSTTSGYAWNE